jgi:hypothetical protein
MLTIWPQSTAGSRMYQEVNLKDDATMTAYFQHIETLLAEILPASDVCEQELQPRRMPLNPEAKILWREFHDCVERQLAGEQPLAPVRGFANKTGEHAIRLAGVLALLLLPFWQDACRGRRHESSRDPSGGGAQLAWS